MTVRAAEQVGLGSAPDGAGGEVGTRVVVEFDVRMFGRFRVFRDGVEVTAPQGQAGVAFKILVLNGGVVHPDMLMEHLWPDDRVDVARARLRNVLSRVRRDTGATIEGRRETVTLLDSVRCDVADFIREGARALSGLEGREVTYRLCLDLQAMWVGPPLEEHRYQSWADTVRGRAFEMQQRLWTRLHTVQDADWPPGGGHRARE